MGFVVAGAVLVIIFVGERSAAFWRKARIEKRRAKADYPINENNPIGRNIV